MFSAVANGSSLAYVKKRGRIYLNFASLSPLRPCVRSEKRKDAMTQGRKDWKPQNPSESENFKEIDHFIQLASSGSGVYLESGPSLSVFMPTALLRLRSQSRITRVDECHESGQSPSLKNLKLWRCEVYPKLILGWRGRRPHLIY